MKHILVLLFALIIAGCADRNREEVNVDNEAQTEGMITGRDVTYSAGGTTMRGYLAYDSTKGENLPGVIVVHEWWGQNEYARQRARMLAELGYAALAVDMFGDGKTADHPDDAGKFAQEVMQNMDSARERFNAGVQFLKNQGAADSSRIAAIGYCFGGGVVLQMTLAGADLDGVVSFHGTLPTQPVNNPDQVKAKILVLNGEADPMVPKEQVDTFKKNMDDADLDYEVVNYPDATHAFTNPAADSTGKKYELPIAYNKEADEKSWEKMKEFLKDVLK